MKENKFVLKFSIIVIMMLFGAFIYSTDFFKKESVKIKKKTPVKAETKKTVKSKLATEQKLKIEKKETTEISKEESLKAKSIENLSNQKITNVGNINTKAINSPLRKDVPLIQDRNKLNKLIKTKTEEQ